MRIVLNSFALIRELFIAEKHRKKQKQKSMLFIPEDAWLQFKSTIF